MLVGFNAVLREQVVHWGLSNSGCMIEFPWATLERRKGRKSKVNRERDACLTPFCTLKGSRGPVSQSSNPISF